MTEGSISSLHKSSCFSEVHKFKIPKRTEGDGMENEELRKFDYVNFVQEKSFTAPICKSSDLKQDQSPKASVNEEFVNLMFNVKPVNLKNTSLNIKFRKEPKFVPYEPYKAATSPMFISKDGKSSSIKFLKNADTNVEDLINLKKLSVTEMRQCHLNSAENVTNENENKWYEEKKTLLEEVNKLKKENKELENQVKFQAQVNAEVKKLLIAAVGEDIETRVQLLTEDKLHLAKQLLNTAKTLSTHQEQIEWLAGQGEVWRSKFLASSMLVEDLAKWKALLCQRVSDYKNALKQIMEDNDKLRQNEFQTFINLSTLQEKFNLDIIAEDNHEHQLISSDLINLCTSNRNLSELLMMQLLRENISKKRFELDPLNCMTAAEKNAEKVLSQPLISFKCTDMACDAVMNGAAIALSSTSPNCCHCKGIVTTV